MRIHTTHTRDAALRELNRATRWLVAASIVLTGVLSDVAASAFSGKRAAKRVSTAKTKRTSLHAHRDTHHTRASSPGALQPPAKAPSDASRAPALRPATTQQAAPAQESTPTQEPAPAQEPAHEAAPAPEAASEPEPAPAQGASGPVVSGGS